MIDGEHFSGSGECRDDWSNHESRGALKARADEAKDEVARLRDVVETYDERFASQHDEHKAEVERLRAIILEEQGKARIAVNAVAVVSERALAEVERLRRELVHERKCAEAAMAFRDRESGEVERLRRLLCWVYELHCSEWALVCDEECEIADLAGQGEP